ncbi:hypothetical protein HKX48_004476 [Thoreauomyces humboldtii]|nr:hypothetical protein HKX48_004476 [Thoreauomyces humboldtii]
MLPSTKGHSQSYAVVPTFARRLMQGGRPLSRFILSAIALLALVTLLFASYSHPEARRSALASALRTTKDALGPRRRTIAAIVESRPLKNLLPVILHFSGVLGPDWPIHIFKGPPNEALLASSPAIRRLIRSGGIVLHDIPADAKFRDHMEVSEFFAKTPWFWEQLEPFADNVLLFQADAMICANSAYQPEDFLQWDYIGAPIAPLHGAGYNGGFSLRHIPSFLATVRNVNWTEVPDVEDQWFARHLKSIPGVRLPSVEQAAPFAVETVWHDRPMGYHQVKRWWPNRLDEIRDYCPDVSMAEDGVLHIAAELKRIADEAAAAASKQGN